jgi:hypothetical protein
MKTGGLAILGAITLLTACGPQAAHPKPTPTPSNRAPVRTTPLPLDQVPPDVSQAWGDIGATIAPPTGYLQNIDFKAEVVNHSGGKVDDATARKWAEALEREYQWDKWVDENLQPEVLKRLGRKDAMTQQSVFGDDYSGIHKAQDAKGKLKVALPTRVRYTLVPVTQEVKSTLSQTYQYVAPIPDWALIVDVAGPAGATLTYPDGRTDSLSDFPTSFRDRAFIAGEFESYPMTLGSIWVASTYLSCAKNDFLRPSCSV